MKTLLAVLLLSALSVGCGSGNSANKLPYPARITLVPAALTLPRGDTAPVTATVYDQFGNLMGAIGDMYWSSSNSTVAAVFNDEGGNPDTVTVGAYSSGETTLSVSAQNIGPPPKPPAATASLVITVP